MPKEISERRKTFVGSLSARPNLTADILRQNLSQIRQIVSTSQRRLPSLSLDLIDQEAFLTCTCDNARQSAAPTTRKAGGFQNGSLPPASRHIDAQVPQPAAILLAPLIYMVNAFPASQIANLHCPRMHMGTESWQGAFGVVNAHEGDLRQSDPGQIVPDHALVWRQKVMPRHV